MRSARLTLALESGALSLPNVGSLAIYRPRIGDDLSDLPQDRVVVLTGFKPDHDHFADRYAVQPEASYSAAIVCLPTGERGLTETPLFREPFLLAVSSSHPLASAAEIEIGQIDINEMLLMERGHCLREQTLETCGSTPDSGLNRQL